MAERVKPETRIADWQDAYRTANDTEPPAMRYEGGWFVVRYRYETRFRAAKVDEMIRVLRSRRPSGGGDD